MKILVVTPAWVGDAIMAQPLYQRLAQQYPQLTLDVLAPAWSAAVHARMPEIHRIIDNPFAHGQLRLAERYALGRSLRKEHYQLAIVLPNSLKSALIPAFAGIPQRRGWRGEMRYGLLNDMRTLDKRRYPTMLERFLALAEAPNHALPQPWPLPRLQITAESLTQSLLTHRLDPNNRPVIALCPGAEYGIAKRWPPQKFAELAQKLRADGFQLWIFGSKKDDAIAQDILGHLDDCHSHIVNLCGRTSLAEAIDLLSVAQLAVTNDSGLMHMAAAVGVPLIAIYGSSSPSFTPPLTKHAKIASLALECSPCFKRECPLGHLRCLDTLSSAYIYQLAQDSLSTTVNPSSKGYPTA